MKKKKRKKIKKTLQPKAPLSIKEAEAKIRSIRAKLQDLKEYKAILAEDGLKADEEDKRRESELIVRLLRLEKQAGITKEKEVPWRGKSEGNQKSGKPDTGKPGSGKPGSDKPGSGKPRAGKPDRKSGGARDSRPTDRDRRPSKDGPSARPERNFRDDDRPVARENKPAGERPSREKKTINRGSKPSGAKKPDDKRGPKGQKKAGGKPARRPFRKVKEKE
jgi:hypothetical protein